MADRQPERVRAPGADFDFDPVVVLGMHRSGTSFLVRALNLSGLWLGGSATLSTVEGRAMIGNPKGNYENRDAISINDAVLKRSGGAWVKPPPRLLSDDTDRERILAFCRGLERGRPAEFPRWGWKDPRTVLTLRMWVGALDRGIFLVGSFRHPSAVARSLLARDKIPLPLGYALWTYYNELLLEYLAAYPHVLVRFDVPKENLIEQTLRVCALAGLRADRTTIERWHDAELVRSDASGEPIPNAQLAALWERLIAAQLASADAPPP